MNRSEWEDLCKRCGKCCYEKVDLGGGVVRYLDEPCKFLDIESKTCTVYDNRKEMEPECITLTEEMVSHLFWLPEDCAYVEYVRHKEALAAVRAADKSKKKRPKRRQ